MAGNNVQGGESSPRTKDHAKTSVDGMHAVCGRARPSRKRAKGQKSRPRLFRIPPSLDRESYVSIEHLGARHSSVVPITWPAQLTHPTHLTQAPITGPAFRSAVLRQNTGCHSLVSLLWR